MGTKLFFENTKTKKRYEVVDRDEKSITLQDADGRRWPEPYSKERFKQLGYTLVREDDGEDEDE